MFRCAFSRLLKHQGMTITHTKEMWRKELHHSYCKLQKRCSTTFYIDQWKETGETAILTNHDVSTRMQINEQVRQFSQVDYCVVGIDLARAVLIEGPFV